MSESLAGTTVDEIVKIGRWETERAALLHRGRHLVHGSNLQRENGPRLYGTVTSCHGPRPLRQFSPRARRNTPEVYPNASVGETIQRPVGN